MVSAIPYSDEQNHLTVYTFVCLFLSFRQYAATVFIVNNRFEMGKKKLAYLTFDDLVHCANEMIATWSNSSKGIRSVLIPNG